MPFITPVGSNLLGVVMMKREWSKAAILELLKMVDYQREADEEVVCWEEFHHPSRHTKCMRIYTETQDTEYEVPICLESDTLLNEVTSRPKSA